MYDIVGRRREKENREEVGREGEIWREKKEGGCYVYISEILVGWLKTVAMLDSIKF